ncbi:type II toxin-antitoxin system HicB family antitoxin [Hydrogenophaga sp.]
MNISLTRWVLHRLDDLAKSNGESRSGMIARMAIESRCQGRESISA